MRCDDRRVDLLRRARQRELLGHVASTTRASSSPSSRASPSGCSGRRPRGVLARAPRPTPARSRRSRRPGRRSTASITARRTRGGRRRATSRRVPSSIVSSSPTKNVWSPVRTSSTVRAVSQPTASCEQARVVLAHLDAVPERDRRHAAREVLREVRLLAGEHRRPPLAGLAQQLVQRRLERDRDPDEPRLERERRRATRRSGPRGGRRPRQRRRRPRQATAGRARVARPRVPPRGRA